MGEEYHTDFMELEIERDVTRWYREFTEYWTVSVAVDTDASDPVKFAVRVVGPTGEAAKAQQLEPDEVPKEVRAKFEDMMREGALAVQ